MEFSREKPDCKFEIADRVTVRQQLAYYSTAGAADRSERLLNSWEAAKLIIIEPSWKCETMPNMNENLDKTSDPQVTEIISWAGWEVRKFMDAMETVPKN